MSTTSRAVLGAAQAEEFVRETPETFRWYRRKATVDEAKRTAACIVKVYRLIADVVCFRDVTLTI